jgi:hypothetical protein
MSLTLVLVILLIVVLLGGLPVAPWGGWHSYGYAPSGVIGVILIVFIILLLMGRL